MSTYRIEPNFNRTRFNLVLILGNDREVDFGHYSYKSEESARAAAERDSQERADEPAEFVDNTPITKVKIELTGAEWLMVIACLKNGNTSACKLADQIDQELRDE